MLTPEPNTLFKYEGDKSESTVPVVPLAIPSAPVVQAKSTVTEKKSVARPTKPTETESIAIKRKLSVAQREIQLLRKQNQELKSRQPTVLAEQADSFSDENKQLHQQLLASEKQLAENARRHEKQVRVLTARAEELQTQMNRIQLSANKTISQKAQLEQQLTKQSDRDQALASRLAEAEKQGAALRTQLEEANKHAAALRENIATSDKNVQESTSRIATLEQSLKDAVSQKAQLEQQLTKQSGSDQALASRLAEAEKQGAALRTQLEEANKHAAALRENITTSDKNVQESTSRIATLEQSLKDAVSQKVQLEQQLTKQSGSENARFNEFEQKLKKADEEKKQALDGMAALQKQHDATVVELDKAKQSAYLLKTHKSEMAKINYAYGAYYAVKVLYEFKVLENLGHKFLPLAFQQGFKDKLANTMQLSEAEVSNTLTRFDQLVGEANGHVQNRSKGQSKQFVIQAAKVKGAEQAQNGVVYLVLKKGKTPVLTVNDTIRFRLDEKISTGKRIADGEVRIGLVSKLPELMQQGVLRVGLGGKIKITVPTELAYGEQGIPGSIPPDVASEITIEVLGIVK